jgi:hypothetical protein
MDEYVRTDLWTLASCVRYSYLGHGSRIFHTHSFLT